MHQFALCEMGLGLQWFPAHELPETAEWPYAALHCIRVLCNLSVFVANMATLMVLRSLTNHAFFHLPQFNCFLQFVFASFLIVIQLNDCSLFLVFSKMLT